MRQDGASERIVHHTFTAQDLGNPVTALVFVQDNIVVAGAPTLTVNPGFPRAVRLRGFFAHTGVLAVNVAGAWTVRIRLNEGGADAATFAVGMAAGGSKDFGQTTPGGLIIQGGSTYHIQADGPSRFIAIARVVLEWEIL